MRPARPGGRWPGGMHGSLRLRLTLLSAAVCAVALAVGALVLTGVVSASRLSALDDIARERAIVVGRLVETGQVPALIPVSEPGEVAQVLSPSGSVVATSENGSRTLPVVGAKELSREVPATAGRDEPVTWTTESSPYGDSARVAALPVDNEGSPVTVVVSVPLDEVEGVLRALRVALWGVVPVLTLLVGALVWIATGRALRPVEELRVAAAGIAASGSGALPVSARDDEIGALARTLEDMLARLRASADRQQAFVADAAHELRSPVASLRAAVDVAAAYPAAYPVDEFATQVGDQVSRLQRLVDDLLTLARLGTRPPAVADVDLAALARQVVAEESAGAGAVTTVIEGTGLARTDGAAVARIVRNLVANAQRHAAARVAVTVADAGITVCDDGPGIAPADRERVFERFTRLDEGRGRDDGGSGLGLAIARETATELGGNVLLDEVEGGGLRARLVLPPGADAE